MQHEVDADFARYVRARQQVLLRAAYLVCGDVRLAEVVLEGALATVAGRWGRLREHPDTAVRVSVYRDALAGVKRSRRRATSTSDAMDDSLSDALGTEVLSGAGGGAGRGPDLRAALSTLSPRQRALLVLRYFEERPETEAAEVLGVPETVAAAETRGAVERLHDLLPVHDVTELLDQLAQRIEETDLADRAWALAVARRTARRRRMVSAVGGLVAVGVVVAVAQGVAGGRATPAPSPTTSSTAAVQRLPDGTTYAAMPLEGDEDRLPDFDAGLPSLIDPRGRAVDLSTLDGPPASVVAVYLRRAGTHYRAVLVPKDREQVVVDKLDLLATRDADGNEGVPLGPKAISPDGGSVVFAQPGAVVRLDLRTGAVDRYAVPAQDLEVAGWGQGRTVVARTASRGWELDLGSASPTPVPAAAAPAALTQGVRVPVTQLVGATVSAGRWSASGAFFDQVVTSPVIVRGNGPIYQGLVAVDVDSRAGRVLLAPESPDGRTGRFVQCCTVLAWADPSTVLFRSSGYDGSWVLAWNVETGRVYDVTRLDQGGGVDYPQALALAVGSRG